MSEVSVLEKRKIRQLCRDKIKMLDIEKRYAASKVICDKVMRHPKLKASRNVMLFVGTFGEPNTIELITKITDEGKKVLLPFCVDQKSMIIREFCGFDAMDKSPFGVLEPNGNCPDFNPADVDLVLTPCLAATKTGKRLGHGKGYYDRFLSKYKIFSIILCLEDFIFDDLPTDEYDVTVDEVITES